MLTNHPHEKSTEMNALDLCHDFGATVPVIGDLAPLLHSQLPPMTISLAFNLFLHCYLIMTI